MKKLFELLDENQDIVRAILVFLTTITGFFGAGMAFGGAPQGVYLIGVTVVVFCTLGILDEISGTQVQSDGDLALVIIFIGALALSFIAAPATGLAAIGGLPVMHRYNPLGK